jgi:hypothetical protein
MKCFARRTPPSLVHHAIGTTKLSGRFAVVAVAVALASAACSATPAQAALIINFSGTNPTTETTVANLSSLTLDTTANQYFLEFAVQNDASPLAVSGFSLRLTLSGVVGTVAFDPPESESLTREFPYIFPISLGPISSINSTTTNLILSDINFAPLDPVLATGDTRGLARVYFDFVPGSSATLSAELTLATGTAAVPEPSSVISALVGVGLIAGARSLRRGRLSRVPG